MNGSGGPWPVDAPPTELNLLGAVCAIYEDDDPVLLAMPGSGSQYLACFTDASALPAFYARAGIPFSSIVQLNDVEGLRALMAWAEAAGVIVIADPWFTERGTVRFKQVRGWT